jgi:alkanesulfonate monooxygenase SsuD/methylene tetrahydromethanopterin reductase-like flavin-dependent oxidoreductase (luciferase family)
MRFGLLIPPDAPFPELVRRWQLADELGFDAAYTADHTGDYRDLSGHWFEGWTTLAALTQSTSRIRIGTLVSNPVLRSPVLLAKQSVAVDHLSNGRLELGVGTGIAGFDHAAVGIDYWPTGERVARFAEYIEVLDRVLRSAGQPYHFDGRYYRTADTPWAPPPVQQPRPPITVGGQSPTVRRVAARFADCWNTHGPFGATVDQILELTAAQNTEMDDLCESYRRSPADVRRSLLLFEALDPWVSGRSLDETVTRFAPVGVTEFVLFWPPPEQMPLLEKIATDVIPTLSG